MSPKSAPARTVMWMPWQGRNAAIIRAREARPTVVFAYGPRDPKRYVPALPPLPLFRTPEAAARARREKSKLNPGWLLAS